MTWSTGRGSVILDLSPFATNTSTIITTSSTTSSSSSPSSPSISFSVVPSATSLDASILSPMLANATSFDLSPENCSHPLGHVDWKDVGMLTSLTILVVINALVVAGNCLVILAVFLSSKLRTVTNLFIVSLAVADLLLGMAVLPFSVTVEVFDTWLFGELWCSVWLAVDVWMSTASILNLCVISLDRYVAVTRPVSYPSLMTSSRAKLLIASVWIASFVICFPPLVGWNDRHKNLVSAASTVFEASADARLQEDEIACHLSCELTNDVGYVVYSALGSFFIPMLVMLFFYWKIYCAAAATTRAINQGFRTTKSKRILGSRFEEERLTLRIHRGRNSVQERNSCHNSSTERRYNGQNSSSSDRQHRTQKGGKVNSIKMKNLRPQMVMKSSMSLPPDLRYDGNDFSSLQQHCDLCNAQCSREHSSVELLSVRGQGSCSLQDSCFTVNTSFSEIESSSQRRPVTVTSSSTNCSSGATPSRRYQSNPEEDPAPPSGPIRGRTNTTSRMGRRNIKVQVKRFRMETKAAKTLGIIVGVFILCWFPFFTMYLVRGFCPICIHPLLFSILFWLGYCNSAINPCIYALFSKDFRFAFKNILCKCICTRETRKAIPAHQPSIYIPSCERDNDSDENFEESKR